MVNRRDVLEMYNPFNYLSIRMGEVTVTKKIPGEAESSEVYMIDVDDIFKSRKISDVAKAVFKLDNVHDNALEVFATTDDHMCVESSFTASAPPGCRAVYTFFIMTSHNGYMARALGLEPSSNKFDGQLFKPEGRSGGWQAIPLPPSSGYHEDPEKEDEQLCGSGSLSPQPVCPAFPHEELRQHPWLLCIDKQWSMAVRRRSWSEHQGYWQFGHVQPNC
jgi:hypothetical protein